MPDLTRRQTLAAVAATGVATGLAAPAGAQEAGARVALRLLATTDLHVNVVPYDYYRDAPDDTVGLAKTATLARAAMAEARNSLLLDNGDLIQGSPLGDYVAYETGLKGGATHPMVAAMGALPYACGTLGNHEFNYGLDYLAAALAGAKFPVVCANVARADGSALVPPWIVLDRAVVDEAGATRTLKLGLIGFVPPQILQWDKGHLEGRLTATDIVDAARRHLPDLLAQKPDLVVALCHSGIAGGPRRGGEENAALHLAALNGIDVLLTGHQHLVFPGPKDFQNIPGVDTAKGTLNGKPAVMAGFWGSHLGVIDLDLAQEGGRWRIAAFKVEARPIYERVERRVVPKANADAAVLAAVRADHEATLAYVRRPVGATTVAIHSYFSLVADDASVKVVCDAQSWYLATQLKETPFRDLPLLSAAAPFKSGGRGGPAYFTDIKPGPLAIKDLADIYIYPNTVRAVRVTGAQLREWLERSAGIYNRIDPAKGGEQELIDPRFPAFNFDVIAGVRYRIDPTQASRYDGDGLLVAPDSRRIRDLTYDGRAVRDDEAFVVATNNYRAAGGGNFPGNDGSTTVFEAPDLTRDVIMRYVVEHREIAPEADGSWALVPPPAGVVATFLTGPGAAGHDPVGLAVARLGEAADGFVRYRVAT